MGGLPLWKLTRNRYGRALYDRLRRRGFAAAALDTFRRPASAYDGTPNGGGAPTIDLAVREPSDEATRDELDVPYKAADASAADLVVVARDGETPIGQVFLSFDETIHIAELDREMAFDGPYVWRLYVAPGHRNRGLGSRLLAAAIGESRSRWGVRPLYALIAVDNRPSRRLFESHGFDPGTRRRYVRCGPFEKRWRSADP
ncbi:GNAT family N-acetyltransferase [Halosolutus gelatinilyticus]|uniref:GNAT family N-acetyltransferase n=1 Tax=Halosolutus gelatinilyticus TaxID=2931975 RepID=UPI001FF41169|nr:GNAT family N-acetyltransferase [Halosolutus gelatinilyticus]